VASTSTRIVCDLCSTERSADERMPVGERWGCVILNGEGRFDFCDECGRRASVLLKLGIIEEVAGIWEKENLAPWHEESVGEGNDQNDQDE